MFTIKPYHQSNFPLLAHFVSNLQDHERKREPDLRQGADIASDYARLLVERVAEDAGTIFFAWASEEALGFVCVWKDRDDDPLLQEMASSHAYISDLFVIEQWRGKGVAHALLVAAEEAMQTKGCVRVRVCAKASNSEAVRFYSDNGYSPYEIVYAKTLGQ